MFIWKLSVQTTYVAHGPLVTRKHVVPVQLSSEARSSGPSMLCRCFLGLDFDLYLGI